MNKSLVEQSRLDGLELHLRKKETKEAQANMDRMKNRIEALKRAVEEKQKKELLAERHRQTII